jgi:hypothetical protein
MAERLVAIGYLRCESATLVCYGVDVVLIIVGRGPPSLPREP